MLILMGAIPAALLAFVLGSLVDALQRKVVPKGIRRGGERRMTSTMILEHMSLVVAALIFAILAGIPLGIICYFYPSTRKVILRVVDLIQTTPALALLGIIMVFMGAGKAHGHRGSGPLLPAAHCAQHLPGTGSGAGAPD